MKNSILLLFLLVSGSAAEPPRPGIGDYLCHLFGPNHWLVCKPHPGNKP